MTVISDQESKLIAEIKSNPSSNESRLIYADWLDDRADFRAAYLRTELKFSNTEFGSKDYEKLLANLETLFVSINETWMENLGIRFDFCLQAAGSQKLSTVRDVRNITGAGLSLAKSLSDEAPSALINSIPFFSAIRLFRHFKSIAPNFLRLEGFPVYGILKAKSDLLNQTFLESQQRLLGRDHFESKLAGSDNELTQLIVNSRSESELSKICAILTPPTSNMAYAETLSKLRNAVVPTTIWQNVTAGERQVIERLMLKMQNEGKQITSLIFKSIASEKRSVTEE